MSLFPKWSSFSKVALRSAWPRVRVYARTAASQAGLRHKMWRVLLSRARNCRSVPPSLDAERKESRGGSSLKNHRTVSGPLARLERTLWLRDSFVSPGESGRRRIRRALRLPPVRVFQERAERDSTGSLSIPCLSLTRVSSDVSLLVSRMMRAERLYRQFRNSLVSADCTRLRAVSVPSFLRLFLCVRVRVSTHRASRRLCRAPPINRATTVRH